MRDGDDAIVLGINDHAGVTIAFIRRQVLPLGFLGHAQRPRQIGANDLGLSGREVGAFDERRDSLVLVEGAGPMSARCVVLRTRERRRVGNGGQVGTADRIHVGRDVVFGGGEGGKTLGEITGGDFGTEMRKLISK